MQKDQQSQQVNKFYEGLWPTAAGGFRCITTINHRTKTARNYFYSTTAEAVAAAYTFDREGLDAYHAVATYEQAGSRKAENAVAIRAFIADIDVGPGKEYASLAEATEALKAKLPLVFDKVPTIVPSGRGFHLYWFMASPLTVAEWKRLAEKLKAVFAAIGLHADPTRTAEAASILRVPGTSNRKDANNVLPVGTPRIGTTVDTERMTAAIEAAHAKYCAEAFDLPAGNPARKVATLNSELSANLPTGPSLVPDVPTFADALRFIDPDCDRATWIKVLLAAAAEYGDAVKETVRDWSDTSEKFDADDFAVQWADAMARASAGKSGVTVGTVVTLARQGGWKPKPSASPAAPELDIDVRAVVGETFGDIANGKVLAALTGGNLQYAPGVGFVEYSETYGHRKLHDGGELAHAKHIPTVYTRYAARMAGDHPDQAAKIKQHAIASSKLSRLTAAVEMLKTEPGVTVAPENVDARGPIVAARNGLVNIQTGEFRPFDRGFVALRRLGVEFDAAATAPKFIDEFLPNLIPDQERRDALQMLLGASLAGERVGERLELLYGARGGEGKSTLVQLIRRIFGTYAAVLPGSVLLESYSQGKGHTAELYSAIGARLFLFGEIDERARICASTVKAFNGGDPMLLRNTFGTSCVTYEFIGLCMMPVNDLPDLNANDGGLKRRVKVWVFYRVQEKPHPGFGHRLFLEEGPGILNWLIEGAAKFARGEYREPAAVVADSAGYLTDHDTIQHWLADHTTKGGPTEGDVLYRAYRAWALNNGHQPVSKSKLGRRIGAKGIARCKTSAGTVAYELGLSDKGKRAAGVF